MKFSFSEKIKQFTRKSEAKYALFNLVIIILGIFGLVFLAFISQDNNTEDTIETTLEVPVCAANYNGDSIIDNYDLVLFIRHYRDEQIDCRYDLTGDCFLDTNDYAAFAKQFGDSCN